MQIFLLKEGSNFPLPIDPNQFLMYEAVIGSFNETRPNSAVLIHAPSLEYIKRNLYIVPLWVEIRGDAAFDQTNGDPTLIFVDKEGSYVGLRHYAAYVKSIAIVLNADIICGDFGLGFKYILKGNL